MEAFLIKDAHQQQTLDLWTSEGRWLQKEPNKHFGRVVFGPLSRNAAGLMSESAASQILLHLLHMWVVLFFLEQHASFQSLTLITLSLSHLALLLHATSNFEL